MSASALLTLNRLQSGVKSSNSSTHGSVKDFDPHAFEKHLPPVTLSRERVEQSPNQPKWSLANTLGNPAPLGLSSFVVAQLPLAMDLLNFRGATAASSMTLLGAFYACAGIGMYLTSIMEWIIGDTFSSVVFGTYAGFYISYAILTQPTMEIANTFASANITNGATAAAAGAASHDYNIGLGMYFIAFGVISFVFLICSLRTNGVSALLFLSLFFTFNFVAAGHFHFAAGKLLTASQMIKTAGGFAFLSALIGIYENFGLLFASVGFPITLPMFDLSTRFMVPKDMEKQA